MPNCPRRLAFLLACTATLAAPAQSFSQESGPPPAAAPARPVAGPIPDTPAGRRFALWLAAFNSADPTAMRAAQEHFAPGAAPPVEVLAIIRQQSGGFDLLKITESSDTRLVALLKGRDSEQFQTMTTEVDTTPEHLVVAMPLARAEAPPEFAIPHLSDKELARQLKGKLAQLAAEDKFSGAVLVLKDGKQVFSGACGYADRAAKLPNKTDTIFRFASMGKMFTATAILQLVQSGKIKLSDTVGTYLPDYRNADIAQKVTIEQLLTHTGGTGEALGGPEYMQHRNELESHADYVKLYEGRSPLFEPGSRYAYSNYGYILLGRIIEVASGEDYYAYLQSHVFAPAGMSSTSYARESEPLKGRAVGYTRGPDGLRSNRDIVGNRGTAAGGGLSTVGDMARFSEAVLGNRLLDAEHTALLTTGRIPMAGSADTKYAFGFGDTAAGTPRHNIGHSGGANGMTGNLLIYPEAGYVVVVLANVDPPAAERVSSWITNRLSI